MNESDADVVALISRQRLPPDRAGRLCVEEADATVDISDEAMSMKFLF